MRTVATDIQLDRQRHLVHVLPSFGVGGVQVRLARVANSLGDRYRHTIIALDGTLTCGDRLDSSLRVELTTAQVSKRNPLVAVAQCRRLLRQRAPDLLVTYNWGSIDWAMANGLLPYCPHLHFEDGFGPEESNVRLRRRSLFRRIALHRSTVVVPSLTLETIATREWHLPRHRVLYVPNGIDCAALVGTTSGLANAADVRRASDSLIIGTVAPLRREKNLARLLRAFAALSRDMSARLVIAGDGVERPLLENEVDRLGLAGRVTFLGQVDTPALLYAAFDIFALTSDTEQMPLSILEAMAMGLPIVSVDVGDVGHMVAPSNREFIVARHDEAALARALTRLGQDGPLRRSIGEANRRHVRTTYPWEGMVEVYDRLFSTSESNAAASKAQAAYTHRSEREILTEELRPTKTMLRIPQIKNEDNPPATIWTARSMDDLRQLSAPWDALTSPMSNPMQHYGWTEAALEAFGVGCGLEVLFSRQGRGGAIAPLYRARTGMLLTRLEPVGVTQVHEVTDFLYDQASSLDALAKAIARLRLPVYIERICADSSTRTALEEAYRGSGVVICRPAPGCPWIPLDESWSEPERHLSSGRRSDLRRARRTAERIGDLTCDIIQPRADTLEPLLDECYRVEAAGWKGRAGSALAHDAQRGAFFRKYAAYTCARGTLRLCFLRIGRKVAAFQYAVQSGNRFLLLKIGYSEEFARCSPGVLLIHETIGHVARSGLEAFEFLGTEEPWITALTRCVHPCVSLHAYPFSVPGLSALTIDAFLSIRSRFGSLARRSR